MNNFIELYGSKYWYKEGCDDTISYNFDIQFLNDKLYIKGKLCHREEGPAIEWSNGAKHYYQYGKLHRIGGPAIEWVNGYKAYYENGKQHREDGPAIEWSDGYKEYYILGKKVLQPTKTQ